MTVAVVSIFTTCAVVRGALALGELDGASEASVAAQATKVYSNSEHRFTFAYPSSWVVVEDAAKDGSLFAARLLSPDENVPVMRERSPGSFGITVFANPRRLAVREWLDSNGWPFGAERSVGETSVAGRRALDVGTSRMFAPNRFIYLADGDRVIRMSPIAAQSHAVLDSLRLDP